MAVKKKAQTKAAPRPAPVKADPLPRPKPTAGDAPKGPYVIVPREGGGADMIELDPHQIVALIRATPDKESPIVKEQPAIETETGAAMNAEAKSDDGFTTNFAKETLNNLSALGGTLNIIAGRIAKHQGSDSIKTEPIQEVKCTTDALNAIRNNTSNLIAFVAELNNMLLKLL
mgnify:CR=1 FL=1